MSSFYPHFGNSPVRQLCHRCGRPLPPNEVYCGNCGHYNIFLPAQAPANAAAQPPAGASWGNASAAPQFSGPPWGQFQGQPQPPQDGAFAGPGMPQQGASMPGQFASGSLAGNFTPVPGQNFPGGFYAIAPHQQAYPPQAPAGSFQPPQGMPAYQSNAFAQPFGPPAANGPQDIARPPVRKNRPRVGRIILGVALLLVLVSGLAGGGYFLTHRGVSTPSAPTTTSSISPTAVPKGNPLFQDAFTNNKNGWDTTSQQGVYSAKVGNGALVLEDDNNRLLWDIAPGGRNFSDFFLTVDAILGRGSQNNGYGIYIRGASNQTLDIATYYRFELYGDGTYAIFIGKTDAGGTSKSGLIAKDAFSPAIHKQGQVNHIAISARGSSMSFLVNGQLLKTFTDNTYSAGSIALFVSNLTPPVAQATFSNLVIYPPQA
jgi:hypothetical protein